MGSRALLGLTLALAFSSAVEAQTQASVERGSYLANTIMACANCHSPKGPPQVTAGKDYSGGLRFNEAPFDVTAPNITPDKETGIGEWTDDQLRTLLLTGKNPHGVQEAEVMPTAFYPILTKSDLDSVVLYLRSLAPVKNKVPDPSYKIALPHHVFPGAERPYTDADLADKAKRGFYLATIGHCMECHTPRTPQGMDLTKIGTGGREFPGPWGVSRSRNITSHQGSGIGAWSDAEIKAAITQGKRRDGSPLKGPMGYQYYAKMTDADLDAMVAYLRTVPPIE